VKLNGYFRTQMQADNVDGNGAKDAPTDAAVDQRLRMKVTNQLNDNVQVVYYGEVDTVWGSKSKATSTGAVTLDETVYGNDYNGDGDILDKAVKCADVVGGFAGVCDSTAAVTAVGGGGEVGADGVNIETKNAYVAFKVPNSIFDFTVGIQGFNLGFDGVVIFQDAAGVAANMKLSDTATVTAHYAKFTESSAADSQDTDYYAAKGSFKLGESKLGVIGLFVNDNAGDSETMGFGAEFNGKFGGTGLNAWALYTDLDKEVGKDQTGYGASVQAVFGKAAVRATYLSGDDGTGTSGDQLITDIGGGAFMFVNENLHINFYDVYYNNLGSTGKALKRAQGLMALNAKYDMMMGDMYLKLGAGYFLTAEENTAGEDELGMEIAARLGQKIAEKVDVSLNAAYATAGDFYGTNTDDMYKVNFMVNVGF
jgi:hypothetical protein